MSVTMEQIVAHAKHRGFVFPGSEIYGGLANTWDYGPLGTELKTTLSGHGGKSSFKNRLITSVWMRRF